MRTGLRYLAQQGYLTAAMTVQQPYAAQLDYELRSFMLYVLLIFLPSSCQPAHCHNVTISTQQHGFGPSNATES
jgi:hypothetical protein